MTRDARIRQFLDETGWGAASRRPLAGDASARRYERLEAARGDRAILMDVPPESGLAIAPFVAVTAWLRASCFSAPEVMTADDGAGLALLEDLGDASFAALCADDPVHEADLYTAAIDALAEIHALEPPSPCGDWEPPPYDAALMQREARLALEWYAPAVGATLGKEAVLAFEEALGVALAPALSAPTVPVLRDYHAENLIWLPCREGSARVGLLDYQDLLIGPRAYDVVSLLEDARRDVSPDLRRAMAERYVRTVGLDPACLEAEASALAAQRNLKILGLFTRLCRRDGKPRYLAMLPRVWAHLRSDLTHPDLAALRLWVDDHLPPPTSARLDRIAEAAA